MNHKSPEWVDLFAAYEAIAVGAKKNWMAKRSNPSAKGNNNDCIFVSPLRWSKVALERTTKEMPWNRKRQLNMRSAFEGEYETWSLINKHVGDSGPQFCVFLFLCNAAVSCCFIYLFIWFISHWDTICCREMMHFHVSTEGDGRFGQRKGKKKQKLFYLHIASHFRRKHYSDFPAAKREKNYRNKMKWR